MSKTSEENLSRELSRLANIVERMTPPIPAISPIPPIPPIPAIPAIVVTGDHELLQRLDVKVDRLTGDVSSINSKLDEKYTTKEEHVILQKVVDGNSLAIRENTKFNDTLNGKIIGIATAIGGVFAVVVLFVSHFWR